MQPVIGPALFSLFQRRITEQEIMKINQMVNEFEKEEEINVIDENINSSSSNISVKYKKTSLLPKITENIKDYKEIKAKIKEMKEIYKILQTKVSDLYKQKKELSELCKNTTLISNSTEGKLSLYKELVGHFNKEIDKKVKSISKQPIAVLLPIFIIIDKNTI
jgi:C-terminal processing protease CtpA/Prc